ncbi:UNVERIFIED_CONTAM: hypothetical protein FKN15_077624 [Acipenser sinensis]
MCLFAKVNLSPILHKVIESKLKKYCLRFVFQLEHAKITQIELKHESFKRNAEINELVKRQEELQERLSEETKAKEQLALELHKAEGILDGYAGERVALEGQVKQKAEIQQHLEQELQLTSSRLQELEHERQIMRQERELLSRQQDAMRDTAGSKELRLVEAAVDAAPEADLLEETEKLMKEKVEVQRQAEKENGELLKQVKTLESELEEQVNKVIEIEQEKKAEITDLRQQIQALEKQLEKNRKFLDARTTKPESDKTISASELALELEQVKYEAAATKEELNSYRERAKKLKDELQVRELTISQLQENLEQAMKTKPERDEPTAASKLASGQEEAKFKAAATQEELNSYKEQAEKLKDELQATQSKTESDEPAPVSKLLLELEEVMSEAAVTKEELNNYRKQAGKLKNELQVREMTIEQLRDDLKEVTQSKTQNDEPAAVSKLLLALEEVKSEAAVTNEELNSYRKHAEKLKNELQVRKLTIEQLRDDLKEATKSKLESSEHAAVSKLLLELEEVKSEAAVAKEELNSYRKQAEKLKDELQVKETKLESDEPADVSQLVLELEEVKSEAASMKEELNIYRKCAEKLKDELQVKETKLESDEPADVSQLVLELEEVKSEAASMKEELNIYRKCAEKLKDELQKTVTSEIAFTVEETDELSLGVESLHMLGNKNKRDVQDNNLLNTAEELATSLNLKYLIIHASVLLQTEPSRLFPS